MKKSASLLEALQIKAVLYPDRAQVQGAIPYYATIGQTWGYRLSCTYDCPSTEPLQAVIPQSTTVHNKHDQE
jgi:hypothetical protein